MNSIDKPNIEPMWNKVPDTHWQGACPTGYVLQQDHANGYYGGGVWSVGGTNPPAKPSHDWQDDDEYNSHHDANYRCHLTASTNSSD